MPDRSAVNMAGASVNQVLHQPAAVSGSPVKGCAAASVRLQRAVSCHFSNVLRAVCRMRPTSPPPLPRSDTGDIDIRIADERVAALWADSAAAIDELPDQLPVVRKAVRAR